MKVDAVLQVFRRRLLSVLHVFRNHLYIKKKKYLKYKTSKKAHNFAQCH